MKSKKVVFVLYFFVALLQSSKGSLLINSSNQTLQISLYASIRGPSFSPFIANVIPVSLNPSGNGLDYCGPLTPPFPFTSFNGSIAIARAYGGWFVFFSFTVFLKLK